MQGTVIATALIARARSIALNGEGVCGRAGCGAELSGGDCVLCQGLYCARHLNKKSFRVLKTAATPGDDSPKRYAWERHYLCDACNTAIDKFHLISLPPIPPGIPENLELNQEASQRTVIELNHNRKIPALGFGLPVGMLKKNGHFSGPAESLVPEIGAEAASTGAAD
jgi:hypothetical protein